MFRWNGIQEGKARNYFLYAIGEILLVVIGILIALSINNWNKEKELRMSEKKIYRNILRKIQEDKSDIGGNADFNNFYMGQYQFAYDIIGSDDRAQIDTLKIILFNLFEYSDYSGSNNIYQNLMNSGDLKLLKNGAIIGEIQELEELYIHINRLETIHWQAILKYVGPGLIDNVHITDLTVERPDDLYDFKFQNLIFSMMGIMSEKDDLYQQIMDQIDVISDLINKELNQ